MTKKKILIAPLDWGLGHATRCVPVINEFLNQGCEVQIASSGDALVLLKEEFPDLKFHSIASYGAEYSISLPFMVKILLQMPKFLRAIKQEHKEIEAIVEREKIDFVVSDNRYGCWLREIPSIFISHQLNLRAPIFARLANYFQDRAIRKFSLVWIPDNEGSESLAGELTSTNLRARHIGVLSRLKWSESSNLYDIAAIVSGPEPQRAIFEKIVIRELKQSGKRCLVVRGLPGKNDKINENEIEIVDHLPTSEMNRAILESELVISRPGYSSIMDLAALGKKAIFIPTPGQTEQEYLAAYLGRKKIAFAMRQNKFNLQVALNKVKNYNGFNRIEGNNLLLKETIEQLLHEAD